MYSALFIANKFIDLALKEKEIVTNMKLQKLVYIANGINLAAYHEPLIFESIEAWPYGPVIPAVYHAYKNFGNFQIPEKAYNFFDAHSSLDEKGQLSLNNTWYIAKAVDGNKLSNWSHHPNSPWSKAKSQNLATIPDTFMEEYFMTFKST